MASALTAWHPFSVSLRDSGIYPRGPRFKPRYSKNLEGVPTLSEKCIYKRQKVLKDKFL